MPRELDYYDDEAVVSSYVGRNDRGLVDRERRLVEEYFTDRSARVLDLGCGAGRVAGALAERGFDVVGVDRSEAMVAAARDAFPGIDFQVGDATALPFAAGAFDYVVFAHVGIDDIRPEDQRLAALAEVRRILAPAGRFAFDTTNQLHRYLFDPRSPGAWVEMGRFLLRNARAGTLGSRYNRVAFKHGVDTVYGITPPAQRRQLARAGYRVVGTVTRIPGRPALLDSHPYYVAEPATRP